MRLANELSAFHERGGEVMALSVDSPGRNAALVERWHLPFPILSDPDGESWLRPLGLWNGEERGGVGVPSVTLVLPDGAPAYQYRSRDFADRPDDDDVLAHLAAAGLVALQVAPWEPDSAPEEHPDAMRTGGWSMYMRGVRSASAALAGRLDGPAREEAAATARMAESFLAAWKERQAAVADGPPTG